MTLCNPHGRTPRLNLGPPEFVLKICKIIYFSYMWALSSLCPHRRRPGGVASFWQEIGSPYPNPFNGKVSIPIRLGNKSLVNFNVYDLSGSVVYSSNFNYQAHSENNIFWDGKSNNGSLVSSGTYILKVINGLSINTKKIIYIK